ncbi:MULTISPECIES: hypothetical protein [Bacillus]|uniref:Uncharacterized protein n=1 Tax=Bacillus smithii 7_3_47FAA TaxID=665952 RepID=G9QLL1_9BACI|nr:hypothetical protein [Bacillus smithii]EHL77970.1 hypothetical protein HMPREF1015_02666 [Bacillus smithii 7_3_47FAA]MED1489449.1 hypothetical protein [Bacillus smithii]
MKSAENKTTDSLNQEESDKTTQGLNQLIEIINAKGDIGELNHILEQSETGADLDEQKTE